MFSEYCNLSGYCVLPCVFFFVIDISHHTVLDPVSTSCWQQITNILCSKYVVLAIVIAIIAVLCVILSTHCKLVYYLLLVQIRYFNVCALYYTMH